MRSSPHCTYNEQTISDFSGMLRRSGQTSRGINSPLYTTQHEIVQQRNRGTFEVPSHQRPGFRVQLLLYGRTVRMAEGGCVCVTKCCQIATSSYAEYLTAIEAPVAPPASGGAAYAIGQGKSSTRVTRAHQLQMSSSGFARTSCLVRNS
jgi:hypothetical protein